MPRLIVKIRVLAVLGFCVMVTANAATPFQFTSFGFNLPRDSQVIGVRTPFLYGKGGGDIRGFDLQLLAYSEMNSLKGFAIPPLFLLGANRIDNEMTGAAFGLLNWHEGYDTGLNAGFVNITHRVNGINFGLINVGFETKGMTLGLVNVTQQPNFLNLGLINVSEEARALNLSLFNYAGVYSAVDVSLINVSEKSNLQVSLVNVTQELKGLQLGLINCAKNTWLPCFILFNIGW